MNARCVATGCARGVPGDRVWEIPIGDTKQRCKIEIMASLCTSEYESCLFATNEAKFYELIWSDNRQPLVLVVAVKKATTGFGQGERRLSGPGEHFENGARPRACITATVSLEVT